MTAQDLKNSILQLAVQGKLVKQREEEGTARELLAQIKAEKEKLIKEKKIKKEKPLPEITEEEKPFEIPESWEWVRLNNIIYNHGQCKPENKFCYIDIGSIDNKNQRLNTKDFVMEAKDAPSRARKIVKYGDVIYSTVRPYLHNMCIIDRMFPYMSIASTGFAVLSCLTGVYNKFLFYYMQSPEFDKYANSTENAKGVAYPAINDDRLYRAIIPIPPFSEQKRIVAKIEEILPYIKQYDKAYTKLETFNKKFPLDMKKSILQLAMQGKLVEQREEEGTAEELYQRIITEKAKLIKEGKIKKEKPLVEITDDEILFKIPESWKWVRLNDLVSKTIKRGKSPTYVDVSKIQVFAQKCNVKTGGIDMSLAKYLDENKLSKYAEDDFLLDKDIVINSTGTGTMGRVGIFSDKDRINDMRIVPDSHVTIIRLFNYIEPYYIFYLLKNFQKYLESMGEGSTNQKELKPLTIMNLILPLPPLAEQKRIVAKLEQLLPYCDQLIK